MKPPASPTNSAAPYENSANSAASVRPHSPTPPPCPRPRSPASKPAAAYLPTPSSNASPPPSTSDSTSASPPRPAPHEPHARSVPPACPEPRSLTDNPRNGRALVGALEHAQQQVSQPRATIRSEFPS